MKKLVLYSSPQCGPCFILKGLLAKTEQSDSLTIEILDATSGDRDKYGYHLTTVPTLVLMQEGKEDKVRTGIMSPSALKSFIG